jgi:hypothetical protein
MNKSSALKTKVVSRDKNFKLKHSKSKILGPVIRSKMLKFLAFVAFTLTLISSHPLVEENPESE